MKITYKQVERAIKNTFEIGVDGTQEQYEAIRACENVSILRSEIKKSTDHFTKSDWKRVYKEIKKLLWS